MSGATLSTLVCNLHSRNTPVPRTSLEHLAVNGGGETRTEMVNGREFLVAPLTLIVPGVLNGSQGPLYYPPEEIRRNVDAWNGVPMVVQHPTRNGTPISGRTPEAMSKQEIGRVYNVRIGDGGKLQAEGWFDVQATDRVDRTIMPRLRKGEPIELSTGLFTSNEPRPGDYNGKRYTHIARNYKPDHLAILPDRTGACSIRDGCGVLVNEDEEMQTTNDALEWTLCANCGNDGMCKECKAKQAKVMNAMTCPKCGKKMVDNEKTCPGCGYEMTEEDMAENGMKEKKKQTMNATASVSLLSGIVANIFCATGRGGGINPTCGKKGGKGAMGRKSGWKPWDKSDGKAVPKKREASEKRLKGENVGSKSRVGDKVTVSPNVFKSTGRAGQYLGKKGTIQRINKATGAVSVKFKGVKKPVVLGPGDLVHGH